MARQQKPQHLRIVLPLAIAAVVGLVAWTLLDDRSEVAQASVSPTPEVAAPLDPAEAPPVRVARAPRPVEAPVSPAPAPAPAEERIVIDRPIDDLDPETRAALEARLARERAAEERFNQGIERSQVRARDIDTRLREALQRVDFEPELLDGGLMRGLRIRNIEGGSPLAEAGFRAGDLVVRMNDRALDDPAELPAVLASSGPELSICAQRGGGEFCRDLVLR